MTRRLEYAFVFAVGLLAGIIVEPYVLRRLANSDHRSTIAAENSADYRKDSVKMPANVPDNPSEPIVAGIPKIEVDEPKYEFGERPAGDVVEHSFKISNRGEGTLMINGIATSCGCTTSELTSKTVPPGGSVQLKVKLDLHMQRGEQNRTIMVQSTDPSSPNLQLTMIGKAIYHVTVTPPYIKYVPSKDGAPHTETVSVRTDDQVQTLNVTQSQTSGKNVEAEVQTIKPGKEFSVKIKVTPEKTTTVTQNWVRLITDHPGEYKVIYIPIASESK